MSRNEGALAGAWCPDPPPFPFLSRSFYRSTLLLWAYLAWMMRRTAVKPSLSPCLTSSLITDPLAIRGSSTRLRLSTAKFSHSKCSKRGIRSSFLLLVSATRYILWNSLSTRSFEPCCRFRVTRCSATVKLGRLSTWGNLRNRVVKVERRCLWARAAREAGTWVELP